MDAIDELRVGVAMVSEVLKGSVEVGTVRG